MNRTHLVLLHTDRRHVWEYGTWVEPVRAACAWADGVDAYVDECKDVARGALTGSRVLRVPASAFVMGLHNEALLERAFTHEEIERYTIFIAE